ncbi:glycosyltransferase family 2 protein [Pedobacter sp. SD-b]|uniref:Glycosyltransferase family 2 protein n=1 Tax=Pedobacter segetis TaxID=2793069 RepID=A0ABS1BNW1_9SPHI|nr:glycosyltransferase family 2 protein [Pedobacter segetis]MBK0384503.1 glycosyltransferase family 2 protein [Pedobacter segetis]
MKVAGFTFIRNAVINDYAIVEAITSILPICDEFVVAVGDSDDGTRQLIVNIASPKIKIIDTVWDMSVREGGKTFALETDKAFAAISKDVDWAFYIQGDECVHEKYLPTIKKEMEDALSNPKIEGLLFKYIHFYGSYDYYGQSRRWYRREVRVIRKDLNVHSYRDAQGFRIDGRKIKVRLIDAYIYHFGWVKPPSGLINKVNNFNTFYHDDDWLDEKRINSKEFDYGNADRLMKFEESLPKVYLDRKEKMNWTFSFDPTKSPKKLSTRRKILAWFEDKFGIRLFEYKNYTKIN